MIDDHNRVAAPLTRADGSANSTYCAASRCSAC